MKCGERGFLTKHGQPCQQEISDAAAGCLWHTRTAEERQLLALTGAMKARVKTLPKTTPRPDFATRESILRWAEETARLVLTGELTPRLAAEARQLAGLALQAHAAEVQEKLVDALLKLEHGGVAFALLSRLTNGGTVRQLPGRREPPG